MHAATSTRPARKRKVSTGGAGPRPLRIVLIRDGQLVGEADRDRRLTQRSERPRG
jgi:hypothetical protein